MYREDSDIEKDFYKTLEEVQKQIRKHLDKASEEIDKAVNLAEENGIYFRGISYLTQKYVANSFEEKWGNKIKEKLGKEDYEEFLQDNEIYSYGEPQRGWKYSDICY